MIMIKLWIRNESKNFYLSTNALKDFIESEGTVEYDGNASIFDYASNVCKKKITNSIMKVEKLVKIPLVIFNLTLHPWEKNIKDPRKMMKIILATLFIVLTSRDKYNNVTKIPNQLDV
uniref:Uncharacterized protein n=1 Tax=Strongyloides stercoralis TaxID=6248 RepID=A0AAF5I3G2_STRER